MADPSQDLINAETLLRAGNVRDGLALSERILARNPDNLQALKLCGIGHYLGGTYDKAVLHLGAAVRRDETDAFVWMNLGNAHQALNDLAQAVECFRRTLGLAPNQAVVHYNLGNALLADGQSQAALSSFQAALNLRPDHAKTLHNIAICCGVLGRAALAVEASGRAVALEAGWAEAWLVHGDGLNTLMRRDEAKAAYERAWALNPGLASAGFALAGLAFYANDPVHGMGQVDRLVEQFPPEVAACGLFRIGQVLFDLRMLDNAAAVLNRAVALDTQSIESLGLLGEVYAYLGRLEDAAPVLERAAAADERHAVALAQVRRRACDWAHYDDDQALFAALGEREEPVYPLTLLSQESSGQTQLRAARLFAQSVAVPAERRFAHGPRQAVDRLRIGYVSGDFRRHPVGALIPDLIESHDRTRVEVFGYSIGPDDQGAERARLVAAFDHFRDLNGLDDLAAARRINDDGIHILVDLSGYTEASRPRILAYGPAPIQVNYLGYPGTMGADFIDVIIADPYVIPHGAEGDYSERVVRLPQTYQCNDRRRDRPDRLPSRAECGLPETGAIYCCFNHLFKITPRIFTVWMEILSQVPGSVLWLLGSHDLAQANLRAEAGARSVDPNRLIFAPVLPPDRHMARLGLADLFLDTLPYNAHTTAGDALWAGVPVLTCPGQTFAGRVASSLLHAVDLPDLIAPDLERYGGMAVSLGKDLERLQALKTHLTQGRDGFALFDTPRFAHALEAAYAGMWAG